METPVSPTVSTNLPLHLKQKLRNNLTSYTTNTMEEKQWRDTTLNSIVTGLCTHKTHPLAVG